MPVDRYTLGLNIYLLIALLLVAVVAIILIVAAWTGVKIVLWRGSQRKAARPYYRSRHAPNGTPYPPSSRGICTRCGQYADCVYHLANGTRVCRVHFDEAHAIEAAPTGDA